MLDIYYKDVIIETSNKFAPLAQLVSAPPCHGGGQGFESPTVRHDCYFAPMVELVDTLVLEASAQASEFKSRLGHHI